jgi:hypothetical protein
MFLGLGYTIALIIKSYNTCIKTALITLFLNISSTIGDCMSDAISSPFRNHTTSAIRLISKPKEATIECCDDENHQNISLV